MNSRTLLFLCVLVLASTLVHAGQQECPAFNCTIPRGDYLAGKFLDRSHPWDEASSEEDGVMKRYYFDTGDFGEAFPDITGGVLRNPFLACAYVCERYNKESTVAGAKVGYWMYEVTCDDGIGGQCMCMNNDTTCDGPWWSDEYIEGWEYGDYAHLPAEYYTGKLCGGHVVGDPHFHGADGSRFDFSGVPNRAYALVSDSHVQVNAFFGGRYAKWENRTKVLNWIRSVSIMWGHHVAVISARTGPDAEYNSGYLKSVTVDGEPLQVSPHGKVSSADGEFTISWTGVKVKNGRDWVDTFVIDVKDVISIRLMARPEVVPMRTHGDAVIHFSVNLESAQLSTNAHGVIGQTFRPDFNRLSTTKLQYSKVVNAMVVPGDNAEGFIDGVVNDYEVKDIEKADCTLCRFARGTSIDEETTQAIAMTVDSETEAARRKLLRATTTAIKE